MTPDEAAAIALALAALTDDVAAAPVDRRSTIKVDRSIGRPIHLSWSTGSSSWSSIDEPRTWLDFARREAVALDVDV